MKIKNYNVISFLHYFLDKTDISRHLRCFTDIKYVRKKRKKILAKKISAKYKKLLLLVYIKKKEGKKLKKLL